MAKILKKARSTKVTLAMRLPFIRTQYVRRHKRMGCCIVAAMNVTERHFDIEGIVLELSQGGLLFRPASRYVMDRPFESVAIRFEGLVLTGMIMNNTQQGYGVMLTEELSPERVQMLIKVYGLSSLKDKHKIAEHFEAQGLDQAGSEKGGFGRAARRDQPADAFAQ